MELEFEYQGKRYRVTRNPEYLRPKGRGTGYTLQKADAVLEYPDGRQPVTKTREVTRAVEELIGLTYRQFTQIAMIAQGDFQKLLLAGTDQRREIFSLRAPRNGWGFSGRFFIQACISRCSTG